MFIVWLWDEQKHVKKENHPLTVNESIFKIHTVELRILQSLFDAEFKKKEKPDENLCKTS